MSEGCLTVSSAPQYKLTPALRSGTRRCSRGTVHLFAWLGTDLAGDQLWYRNSQLVLPTYSATDATSWFYHVFTKTEWLCMFSAAGLSVLGQGSSPEALLPFFPANIVIGGSFSSLVSWV